MRPGVRKKRDSQSASNEADNGIEPVHLAHGGWLEPLAAAENEQIVMPMLVEFTCERNQRLVDEVRQAKGFTIGQRMTRSEHQTKLVLPQNFRAKPVAAKTRSREGDVQSPFVECVDERATVHHVHRKLDVGMESAELPKGNRQPAAERHRRRSDA